MERASLATMASLQVPDVPDSHLVDARLVLQACIGRLDDYGLQQIANHVQLGLERLNEMYPEQATAVIPPIAIPPPGS